MGVWSTTSPQPTPGLTAEERQEFATLDAVIERGVKAAKAVMDAGRALAVVRDRQLYRSTYANWETYLSERHGLTRRRADQLVAAASAMDAVSDVLSKTGTMVPSLDELSERTVREIVGMDAGQAAEAIVEAAGSPDGLTHSSVAKAARRRRKVKAFKVPRPRRFKVPGAVVVITFNRKGSGSILDALTAAMRQAEDLIEAENREAA